MNLLSFFAGLYFIIKCISTSHKILTHSCHTGRILYKKRENYQNQEEILPIIVCKW